MLGRYTWTGDHQLDYFRDARLHHLAPQCLSHRDLSDFKLTAIMLLPLVTRLSSYHFGRSIAVCEEIGKQRLRVNVLSPVLTRCLFFNLEW